jgi:ribosomal protein S27AE
VTIGAHAVHATPLRHGQRDCPACGAPQASMADFRCGHCGATLAVARLAEASAAVQPLAAALREAAARPPPEVVARRLEVVDRNARQQRDWAAQMQAEADATRRGADWPQLDDEGLAPHARSATRWFAWVLFGAVVLLWLVLLA